MAKGLKQKKWSNLSKIRKIEDKTNSYDFSSSFKSIIAIKEVDLDLLVDYCDHKSC